MGIAQNTLRAHTQPFRDLDAGLRPLLAAVLPGLADEVAEAISLEVPGYSVALEGDYGTQIRKGTELALAQFVAMFGSESERVEPDLAAYVSIGRGEMRAGRTLDSLQAAYRVGARVAWRRIAEAARGLDHDQLILLAESLFAYIDTLAAASVEGFAQARAAMEGERQQRRARLARLLVEEPHAEEALIERAATDANWPLPKSLAALVSSSGEPERLIRRAGQETLGWVSAEEVAVLLVPDPDRPAGRAGLRRALSGAPGAIGPTGSWRAAGVSLHFAALAGRLQREGALPGGLISATDHLGELALLGDRRVASALVVSALSPLEDLPEGARERLKETLAVWLRNQSEISATAADLHLHPQTIRYRVAQLREVFGEALADPTRRLDLELALRAEGALGYSAKS